VKRQAIERRKRKPRRPLLTPRQRVAAAARIVVKVGTNVVMRDDGSASIGVLYGIAESLANLRRAGRELLLVSSGAVGLGAQRLGLASKPSELVMIQACAAIGQSRLMSLYDDAFEKLGYRVTGHKERYYDGREDALRMSHDLTVTSISMPAERP